MTPLEQLRKIFEAVGPLYRKREALFYGIEKRLRAYDIFHLSYRELEENEKKLVKKYSLKIAFKIKLPNKVPRATLGLSKALVVSTKI